MIPKLVVVKPHGLSYEAKKIAEVCWGFVETRGKTFDELSGNAESETRRSFTLS